MRRGAVVASLLFFLSDFNIAKFSIFYANGACNQRMRVI